MLLLLIWLSLSLYHHFFLQSSSGLQTIDTIFGEGCSKQVRGLTGPETAIGLSSKKHEKTPTYQCLLKPHERSDVSLTSATQKPHMLHLLLRASAACLESAPLEWHPWKNITLELDCLLQACLPFMHPI